MFSLPEGFIKPNLSLALIPSWGGRGSLFYKQSCKYWGQPRLHSFYNNPQLSQKGKMGKKWRSRINCRKIVESSLSSSTPLLTAAMDSFPEVHGLVGHSVTLPCLYPVSTGIFYMYWAEEHVLMMHVEKVLLRLMDTTPTIEQTIATS